MKVLSTRFLKEVKERIEDSKDSISSNACTNMQDYGFRCGRKVGMEEALDIFSEIFEELSKSDPDFEDTV